MKRTWPSRIRWYSSATGSLTLRIRSAAPHTSSARGEDHRAGARLNSASVIDDPTPAPASMTTSCPCRGEFVHASRCDRDPVLVVLDFAGDTDLHSAPLARSSTGVTPCCRRRRPPRAHLRAIGRRGRATRWHEISSLSGGFQDSIRRRGRRRRADPATASAFVTRSPRKTRRDHVVQAHPLASHRCLRGSGSNARRSRVATESAPGEEDPRELRR